MSIALIVDADCDLPKSFLDSRGIQLLPNSVNVDGKTYTDNKDPNALMEFYKRDLFELEHKAEAIPFSRDLVHYHITEDIVPNYDFALVQTVSEKLSEIYGNCTFAQPYILKTYRAKKERGTYSHHFGMRVVNSGTMFSGQGLLAAYTSDLIANGMSKQDLVKRSEAMATKIYAYAIPKDIAHLRDKARAIVEKSFGAFTGLFGMAVNYQPIILAKADEMTVAAKVQGFDKAANQLFDYAINQINTGLLCPYVVISIAGDESDLKHYDSYLKLLDVAQENNVTVITCIMGLTSGLNFGPGAITLALAAQEHTFE